MMNSIPCSKRSIVFLLLAVAVVGAVGTAAAVTVTEDDVPNEVKAETGTSVTVTLDDPYEGAPSEWTPPVSSGNSPAIAAPVPANTNRASSHRRPWVR